MICQNKKLLGQLLIEKKVITPKDLEQALEKQKESKELLGLILCQIGAIRSELDIFPALAEKYGVEYVDLKSTPINPEALSKIPYQVARRYKVIPIKSYNGTLVVGTSRPQDLILRDDLGTLTGKKLETVLCNDEDVIEAIRKYYGVGADTMKAMMQNAPEKEEVKDEEDQEKDLTEPNLEELQRTVSAPSISNFLNQVFVEAYEARATDIHIEPYEDSVKVRFRVDGVLLDVPTPESVRHFKEYINTRLKIMSTLDIAERRAPQDGRFRLKIDGKDLDFRISFMPTKFGESAVIRILNNAKLLGIADLDLNERDDKLLRGLIQSPNGIIFMTGPTGSGKTTTLYSCLSEINTSDRKIITIEDPIEYQIPGITQIQVNQATNLTFAKGLRSILRHDPDVILVGEVRDVETAEIAIQVALTGHLVFSTLHTNDAVSGITRLINMGIEPYLITSTVECFIAQRLVRLNCPHCKTKEKLGGALLRKFRKYLRREDEAYIYRGQGCPKCNHTGYRGRIPIYEFFVLNDAINQMIIDGAPIHQIKTKAQNYGMRSLRYAGWEKIKQGLTTPDEVIRATQERSNRGK